MTALPRVWVLGAGSMGAGIAQLAAQAGHDVCLYDAQPPALERALAAIAADLDGAVSRGKLGPERRGEILGRIRPAADLEAGRGSGIVVEAIIEDLGAKQDLLRRIEPLVADDALLLSNTSSLSVTAIAAALARPQRVAGWHFFNPAVRMKLVEIIPGMQTDTAVVDALRALSRSWGKTAVAAPNVPGFIVNRVARPYYAEAWRLLAERAAPAPAIDALLRQAGGFALGPFELMDLIGHDVNLAVTESVFRATGFDSRYAPALMQQELVRAGRLGRKSGHGVYRHGPDAAAPGFATVAPASGIPVVRHAAAPGLLGSLLERLRGAGVPLETDSRLPDETLAVGGSRIATTDGRTAAHRAAVESQPALILLDTALDLARTPLLGAAPTAAATPDRAAFAAALDAAGVRLVELADVAGLVVMRVVAGLVNEAADLASWNAVAAADIDLAMQLGTAYPRGPLAWGRSLGAARVHTVLRHLSDHYGDARYRIAPRLSESRWSGAALDA